jgi:alpha-L-fucosidase 2
MLWAIMALGTVATADAASSSVLLGAASPIGHWEGHISGPPNRKLPDAPTLGNGYTGVMLGDSHLPGSSSIDLWVNTNSMWGCDNNTASTSHPGHANANWGPGRLTPAVCSLVGLGGVSFAVQKANFHQNLVAEQRIENGQLFTKQTTAGPPSGTVETLTYIHPLDNSIVTNITSTLPGAVLDVVLWVYTNGRTTTVGADGPMLWASREASYPCQGDCDDSIKRIHTALAVKIGGAASVFNTTSLLPKYASAGARVTLPTNGKPLSIVTALADNLLKTNGYDPTPDAKALATSSSASAVEVEAASYWSAFWGKSSVSLPSSPAVEAYWRGAQYATACMTPTTELLAKHEGKAPPSGLYGPWVSGDNPSWNGDCNQPLPLPLHYLVSAWLRCAMASPDACAAVTLDYNQEAQYYGVFSSNHEELSSAYFPPITDWMGAARQSAQA